MGAFRGPAHDSAKPADAFPTGHSKELRHGTGAKDDPALAETHDGQPGREMPRDRGTDASRLIVRDAAAARLMRS